MEKEDFRAFYIAYRRGLLNDLHPVFHVEHRPQSFADAMTTLILDYFDAAWTFRVRGEIVGMLFGRWMGSVMYIGSMTWVADCSPRDKLAVSVDFLLGQRQADYTCVWTTLDEASARFSLRLAQYAVARRVGTAHLPQGDAKVFEVRR